MASLQELLAQRAEIEKKITEMQSGARTEAIANIKAVMAEFGLSMADISGGKAPKAPRPQGKVAAKYRNGSTGESWSGRGLKPKWLTAALASGATLESFAV